MEGVGTSFQSEARTAYIGAIGEVLANLGLGRSVWLR